MKRFFKWLDNNRRAIGYTVGGLNIVAAMNYAWLGLTTLAVVWTVIGVFLLWDTYEYK